jgi:hypothetical protein
MSNKHLFAIVLLLSTTFAAPGAIADVSERSADAQDRGGTTQGDTDEEATRRLLEQFRARAALTESGNGNRRRIASRLANRDDRLRDIELSRVPGENGDER